ncbi:MAG: MgtC/SapB family protein, partial [Chloroflexota bacterium]
MPDLWSMDATWPHVPTLVRLGLALGIGLFVGLERERRGKEAGLRTFGFAALLGGFGGLLGDQYALLSLALLGVLVGILNWQTVRTNGGTELTTSAALLVIGFAGVAAGKGHTFTPVAVGVSAAALLAWKENLADFSLGLKDVEVRSAILLAILAFIVYPALPAEPIDPWGLVEPRGAWVTVILIAALGFANYILLKLYGEHGVAVAGFLGGLVNSTVTVAELAGRVRDSGGRLAGMAYRGVLLSTTAMIVRNVALLAVLSPSALAGAAIPLGLMLVVAIGLARFSTAREPTSGDSMTIELESPFSLHSALKFGLIFLALEVVGTLAQAWLGRLGFYGVSLVGGVVSSASAVASAASLSEHGRIVPMT